MTVLGCDYLSQHVLEFHSFGLMLMLGSSHPEVKVALKIFENSQENTCAGAFFLRKLQNARKFSEIFRGNFFAGHLRTTTSQRSLFHDLSEKTTF